MSSQVSSTSGDDADSDKIGAGAPETAGADTVRESDPFQGF